MFHTYIFFLCAVGIIKFRDYCLEDFEMSSFSENYNNLKNELNKDQSKLISLLFFGIILGRVYEKFLTIKKSITRKFK